MNTLLSKVRTGAYAGSDIGDYLAEIGPQNGEADAKVAKYVRNPS